MQRHSWGSDKGCSKAAAPFYPGFGKSFPGPGKGFCVTSKLSWWCHSHADGWEVDRIPVGILSTQWEQSRLCSGSIVQLGQSWEQWGESKLAAKLNLQSIVIIQHGKHSKNNSDNKKKQVLGGAFSNLVFMEVLQKSEHCCSRLVDVKLRSKYLWYPHILHIALGGKSKWNIGYKQFLLSFFLLLLFCVMSFCYVFTVISVVTWVLVCV